MSTATIRAAAPLLDRWRRLGEELDHPDVELTIEEAAPLFATFNRLRAIGHEFDGTIIALMKHLQRQAFHSGDDSDADHDDAEERRI